MAGALDTLDSSDDVGATNTATGTPTGGLSTLRAYAYGPGISGTPMMGDPMQAAAKMGRLVGLPDPDSGQAKQDENDSFYAGLLKPTATGTQSESLSNAIQAPIALRQKEQALRAQYIPAVMQAVTTANMTGIQMQENRQKLLGQYQDHINSAVAGLVASNPGSPITFNDVSKALSGKVMQGLVPYELANSYLSGIPSDKSDLTGYLKGVIQGGASPDARATAMQPKTEITDTGGKHAITQTTPGTGEVKTVGALPNSLTPKDMKPEAQSSAAGPVIVQPLTGQAGLAGTPEGAAAAASIPQGGQGSAPGPVSALPPPSQAGGPPQTGGQPGPAGQQPPPGGGSSVGSALAQQKYAEASGDTFAKYEGSLNDEVKSEGDLMTRIGLMQKQLQNFTPGATLEARQKAAAVLKDTGNWLGLDPSVVNDLAGKVNGGGPESIAATQTFQKLAVTGAMEALKTSMQSGRITQGEFQVFQAANPNINQDPQAIQKVFNFLHTQYSRDYTEQQELSNWKHIGKPATDFPAYWSQRSQELGYTPKVTTPTPSTQNPPAQPPQGSPPAVPAGNRVVTFRNGTSKIMPEDRYQAALQQPDFKSILAPGKNP